MSSLRLHFLKIHLFYKKVSLRRNISAPWQMTFSVSSTKLSERRNPRAFQWFTANTGTGTLTLFLTQVRLSGGGVQTEASGEPTGCCVWTIGSKRSIVDAVNSDKMLEHRQHILCSAGTGVRLGSFCRNFAKKRVTSCLTKRRAMTCSTRPGCGACLMSGERRVLSSQG
jgi:hypothetical protein